jgi:hypothetical protein
MTRQVFARLQETLTGYWICNFNGAGNRNRTSDLRITNALLYLLSYTGLSRGADSTSNYLSFPSQRTR